MTPLLWSQGHVAWPLFAAIVFSVVCLIATDIAWRMNRTRFRNFAVASGVTWVAGIIVIGVLSLG